MGQARQTMTMRATIERDTQTTIDGYGRKGAPDWTVVATAVACRVWEPTGTERQTTRNNLREVTENNPQAIFPLDTDIQKEDRLPTVTDRRGTVLFEDLWVDGVKRRADHYQVRLRQYA